MLPVGHIANDVAFAFGFTAAAIAVCGFLGQSLPALLGKDDRTVRATTVVGGLAGCALAVGVTLVDRLL